MARKRPKQLNRSGRAPHCRHRGIILVFTASLVRARVTNLSNVDNLLCFLRPRDERRENCLPKTDMKYCNPALDTN
uniref:Putative secreted protein n=1 Tax=Ixodes ricinus TaxID=34613 RepID=A0A6B0U4B7_IXORI